MYLIRNGRLFRQYELDPKDPIPVGWVHESFVVAEVSGPGWIPVREEAWSMRLLGAWEEMGAELGDGLYELKGSKLCPV